MITDSGKWFWLTCSLIVVALVYLLSPILAPFLVAILLAYMGNPVINQFTLWHIPRTLGVLLLFALVFCALMIMILLLVPALERQITLLMTQLPAIGAWLYKIVTPSLEKLFPNTQILSLEHLQAILAGHWQQAGSWAATLLARITSSGLALLLWLIHLILIPIVAFYLMRDWDRILMRCQALIPRPLEARAVSLIKECNEMVGAFFRGQLIVMLALGTIYSLGLWLAGLPTAILIGFIAGLASIVPYLGFTLGLSLAMIAGIFQFDSYFQLIYIVLAFGVGQLAESMVLTPILIGDRIGLHPVAVIFAILAGAQLFGFVGVLLALPVAAILVVLLRHVKSYYQTSPMYMDSHT